jgi:hypothetical protein
MAIAACLNCGCDECPAPAYASPFLAPVKARSTFVPASDCGSGVLLPAVAPAIVLRIFPGREEAFSRWPNCVPSRQGKAWLRAHFGGYCPAAIGRDREDSASTTAVIRPHRSRMLPIATPEPDPAAPFAAVGWCRAEPPGRADVRRETAENRRPARRHGAEARPGREPTSGTSTHGAATCVHFRGLSFR